MLRMDARPRNTFAHKCLVRFLVEEGMELHTLTLVRSLPTFKLQSQELSLCLEESASTSLWIPHKMLHVLPKLALITIILSNLCDYLVLAPFMFRFFLVTPQRSRFTSNPLPPGIILRVTLQRLQRLTAPKKLWTLRLPTMK